MIINMCMIGLMYLKSIWFFLFIEFIVIIWLGFMMFNEFLVIV